MCVYFVHAHIYIEYTYIDCIFRYKFSNGRSMGIKCRKFVKIKICDWNVRVCGIYLYYSNKCIRTIYILLVLIHLEPPISDIFTEDGQSVFLTTPSWTNFTRLLLTRYTLGQCVTYTRPSGESLGVWRARRAILWLDGERKVLYRWIRVYTYIHTYVYTS